MANFTSRALRLLAAALVFFAAPAAASPSLWEVRDTDTTIYLFASIHALPPEADWLSRDVLAAYQASDEILFEAIPPDPAAAGALMRRYSRVDLAKPLEVLPADLAHSLTEALDKVSLTSQVARYDLWHINITMEGAASLGLDVSAANGVESVLRAKAEADGKKMDGLETFEDQLRMLDSLSREAQARQLTSTLQDPDAFRRRSSKMIEAWLSGDEEELARVSSDSTLNMPALRVPLIEARNARWAKWIAKRMKKPGTAMVVVGAAHFVGDRSLPDWLEEAGFAVIWR